ncbi:MAG: DMT family transporter [Rhodospirillales bacterium]|nr:DMT family transporter [Rhodospirillales bacterium]
MTVGATVLVMLVFVIAMGYPIQAGVNGTLAQYLGHPLLAALTNTTVASLALIVMVVLFRVPLPALANVTFAPWWAWTGGLLGATFVFSALTLAPKLGAAVFVSTGVVGTMISSLLLDHFGLIGYRPVAITPVRIMGVALVIAGMLLLQWKPSNN